MPPQPSAEDVARQLKQARKQNADYLDYLIARQDDERFQEALKLENKLLNDIETCVQEQVRWILIVTERPDN